MIYTVGIDTNDFKKVRIKDVYRYFKDKPHIQADGETSGFNCHTESLMCFQLGDKENQFVIHGGLIKELKELLEEKLLIGQNFKFDLQFLYVNDIFPTKVYDTFLAETVLTCGMKSVRRNLGALGKKYLDLDIDKTIRDNIWKEGLTKRVIEYAANDVKHLEDIMNLQMMEIKAKELQHTLSVENEFVMVLAYIEYCGFKFNTEKWKFKMEGDLADLKAAEEALDKYIIDNGMKQFMSTQMSLFSTEMPVLVNWSSSPQVVKVLNSLGIDTKVVEDGVIKNSVDAKNIGKYKKEHKIVELYLNYKGCEKVCSTYGQTFIDQINPVTGRLHTNFKQIMDTGRLSSGGKNKLTGEEYINFQNIPALPDPKERVEGVVYERDCFIAEDGHDLIIADYTGQEQIVLANKSLDKGLLEFYDKGLGDMHCFVASKMYPELEGLDFDTIKKEHKDKRQKAKTAGFAINYGGVGATIARNNNLTIEEGEYIYNSYFNAFPDLPAYFDSQRSRALDTGYIEFNDVLHTKSYIEGFEKFKERKERIGRDFWDRWKFVKAVYLEQGKLADEYAAMKQEMSEFFKFKGAIERKALNYPIQGTSASITKISAIYFFKWLRKNNLFNTVKFVNTVHDENVVESPKQLTSKVKAALEDCMIRAGKIFCKRVPLKVGVDVSSYWQK